MICRQPFHAAVEGNAVRRIVPEVGKYRVKAVPEMLPGIGERVRPDQPQLVPVRELRENILPEQSDDPLVALDDRDLGNLRLLRRVQRKVSESEPNKLPW